MLPVAVVVQVFMGDVGNHRDVKFTGNGASLSQTVRCALQHAVGHAGAYHLCQVSLNGRRIGRGHVKARVNFLVTDQGVHRRDHAGLDAVLDQYVVDHAGGAGFAVGSGHADHAQLAGREVLRGGCQPCQCLAWVVIDLEIRYAEILWCRSVANNEGCPTLNGGGNVVESIETLSFDGKKSISG